MPILLKFGILVHYGSPYATNWLKFAADLSQMAYAVKIGLKWQCSANCHLLLVYWSVLKICCGVELCF